MKPKGFNTPIRRYAGNDDCNLTYMVQCKSCKDVYHNHELQFYIRDDITKYCRIFAKLTDVIKDVKKIVCLRFL